jgi:hypothetical protein
MESLHPESFRCRAPHPPRPVNRRGSVRDSHRSGAVADPLDPQDAEVRVAIYETFAATGRAPTPADLARKVALTGDELAASLGRLAEGRAIVRRPDSGEIWMAMPFSAVPTQFVVHADLVSWWANCAWDALGIPAALGVDATIHASCGDCEAPMKVVVTRGALTRSIDDQEAVVHFAVPPRDWWTDIGFT